MDKGQTIKWWWNIQIILLIGILVPLGVRSVITGDNRYGWGTFSQQVVFKVDYYWITENGKKIKYKPGKELSGKVRKKLKETGSTRYSRGALKSWLNNYVRYVYLNKKKGDKIKSFRAVAYYKINSNFNFKSYDSELEIIMVEYPRHTMDRKFND